MKSYLFVCLGNICRSPLCEGFAKDYSKKNNLNLIIDSAGTSAYHINESPCELSINIAKQHKIDISKLKARQVTKSDFTAFDYIIALDNSNYKDLKQMGCKNLHLLGSYGYDDKNVPDPYYYQDQINIVWEMIDTCVRNLIKETNT